MARPRPAALVAVTLLATAITVTPTLAASPTPTPTPTAAPTPTPTPPTPALARITDRVERALRGNTAKHADYKITIDGIGTIAHAANTATAPASNEKLLTSLALLTQAEGSFRYVTAVSGTAQPVSGTLDGDLVLVGSGDPTLTRGNLEGLAHKLYATGLRRVTGRLVVDDSRYGHGTRAPGWKHDFLPDESGAVDAFSVNNDDWRSSSSYLADPTSANAGLWRSELKAAGIHVAGSTQIGIAPRTLVPLVSHSSRTLSAIVRMTLHESINYYAEMMLREFGWQATGNGTRATGVAAIHRFARQLSLPVGRVEDGSGLSYQDRETPGTYIAWLTKAKSLPSYDAFYDGLAVSCRHGGTLQYRMCGAHVKGQVHAKTGTLDNITSLSGYTRTEGGRDVAFSFLFSGARSVDAANRHIDAAITAVVRSTA